jgi:hypothetical protein
MQFIFNTPTSAVNYLQLVRASFEMGKSAKVHKRSVRLHASPWHAKFVGGRSHKPPPRTPEKDNEQRQRFHIRGVAIAVQGTTLQVRASANGRSVRGEKIEATSTKRKNTRKERLEGHDRRGECECECERWCVVVVVVRASCARRCGLRGYRDGKSTARARGGAKAASSRVVGRCYFVLLHTASVDRSRLSLRALRAQQKSIVLVQMDLILPATNPSLSPQRAQGRPLAVFRHCRCHHRQGRRIDKINDFVLCTCNVVVARTATRGRSEVDSGNSGSDATAGPMVT